MSKKTPMQELIEYTTDLLHTFDSEERVAMVVLDYLKTNKRSLLEKEKEVMCEFQDLAQRSDFWVEYDGAEGCFDKTFNTKEK